jgi:hypothetical protein
LNDWLIFTFFKALRNLTIHHSVLLAPTQTDSFERPLSRHIHEGSFSSERSQLRISELRNNFEIAIQRYPRGRRVFTCGKAYLDKLQSHGGRIYWDDLMTEVLRVVSLVLNISVGNDVMNIYSGLWVGFARI